MRYEPLIAAVLLAVSIPLGARVDRLGAPRRFPSVEEYPVPADRVTAALCARRIGADFVWVDLLQYCGDAAFVIERGARVTRLARRATALDPGFLQVYLYAGSALMWQCDRPAEAAALLEAGIARNPSAIKLQYYLAAFTFKRLKNFRGEMAILERLAFEPDAPIILRRILANAYEKDRQIPRAADIWRLVLATSDDAGERRWATVKLSRYGLPPTGNGQKNR